MESNCCGLLWSRTAVACCGVGLLWSRTVVESDCSGVEQAAMVATMLAIELATLWASVLASGLTAVLAAMLKQTSALASMPVPMQAKLATTLAWVELQASGRR